MTPGDTTESRARVRTRARELAIAQGRDHAIIAKLSDELELPYEEMERWVDENATQIERWRHVGEADLCEMVGQMLRGEVTFNGTQLALVVECARQQCGWSRESVPEQVTKGYNKAKRDRAKHGPKSGPTGVAA